MTSEPLGGGDQPVDLGRSQVLPAAALGIGLFRRRSHGEWTFPKTISGAVVAGALRAKLHLGPKQVTFPKRHFIGKVSVQSIRWKRPRARPTDARRRQQAADRPLRGRKARAVRLARLRRLPAGRVLRPERRRTRSGRLAQGTGGTGLVPAADRVFQGQAGLLRLLLARRSAQRHRLPDGTLLSGKRADAAADPRQRALRPTPGDRRVVRLSALGGHGPGGGRRQGRPSGEAGRGRDLHPDGAAGLPGHPAHRAPGLHHAAGHHQRGAHGGTPTPGTPRRGRAGRGGPAGPPRARGHPLGTGGAQAGHQALRLPHDGDGAPEARHLGALAPGRESAAAQARHLAAERRLLRQPRPLLHGLRPAPAEARPDPPVPALLCLAALPPAHRQPGRGLRFPHGAAGSADQGGVGGRLRPGPGRQQEGPRIGRVLLLYVDDTVDDATPFGDVRHRAFTILPREAMLGASQRLCEKPVSQLELRWQAVDRTAARCKKHLRPLAMALEVSATTADNPWLAAWRWMKGVFSRQQRLAQRPLGEIPENTIPDRLRPHLLDVDEDGKAASLRGDRYEFWIYRQLRKRLVTGELHLDDSVRHRRFGDELIASDRAAEALRDLDSPWLRQPVDATLDSLCADLHQLWLIFNRDLRQGKLKHLEYDPGRKTLSWRTPKVDKEEALQAAFYARLPARGIADIFRFVDERCRFLAALTPLQPRYAKRITDDDSLTAVILGQAMNHGNLGMAETSDIPYHVLEATHQQHLRLSTLKAANDRVSNFIAGLGIFPFYSFDPAVLYGSVDGQKFAVAVPTAKARHSRKYFGTGRGVVAYTLLANHVPLETELIGAHEHESHYVFDICYHNTSDIAPTTITGDMHSINRANFAILHWFGLKLAPRFTRRQAQLKHLYCGNPIEDYQDCLVQPAGRIDRALIVAEKASIDRIVATLGLKEMSQATLVRKLRTYVAAATKWPARTSSPPPRPPSAGLGPKTVRAAADRRKCWAMVAFRMVEVGGRPSRPPILAPIARAGDISHE